MNFFDDDFGLGSTPTYTRKQSATSVQKGNLNADQISRKSAKQDQFDDLLNDLMGKEQKKSKKKKDRDSMQPYSSTFLEPNINNNMDFKRTEKWSTSNIELDPYMQSPKFPLGKHTSIMDDKISEDGRSYKSGFTGKHQAYQFDNLMTLRGDPKQDPPALDRSTRNMMKPPLRKKQSKQNLIKDQKETSIWDEQPALNFIRKTPEPNNLDLNFLKDDRSKFKDQASSISFDKGKQKQDRIIEKIIEKEKIITVREQATELKKQFQNQIRQIKESYQRQNKITEDRLKKQIQQHKQTKIKISQQYQKKLYDEKEKSRLSNQQNTQRIKDLYEWQLRKKSQAYENQIEKLRSISRMQQQILKSQNRGANNQNNQQIKHRERQIQIQKQRIQQRKNQLQQRQRYLQNQQQRFNQYKKAEQEKLQHQRRLLYQKQNDIKKLELQSKRNLALEKQRIANDLAEAELEIFRKKQNLNLEKQELKSIRQILQQQKSDFEAFNSNILKDYRAKIKEVQVQKQHLNELQIAVHKKIHVLTMNQGNVRKGKETVLPSQCNRYSTNGENHRNRSNTQINTKLQQTKGRFNEIQALAKKAAIQTEEQRQKLRSKIDLSGYMNRMNRALSKH